MNKKKHLGRVVQSIISLTSPLVVKMLTALVSTISNSQLFLQVQKLLTFFSKNISIYAIFNDQRFNDTLTNDIVTVEQLGPGVYPFLRDLVNIAPIFTRETNICNFLFKIILKELPSLKLYSFPLTLVLLNKLRMPCPFLIFSQSDYLIQIVDINSHT